MGIEENVDVGELKSELGSALRAVAVADADGEACELLYVRPDVEEKYPDGAASRVFDHLLSEHVDSDTHEADFEALGSLEFTVRSFEEGCVVTGLTDDVLVFASLDGSEHFLPATMHVIREQLGRRATV